MSIDPTDAVHDLPLTSSDERMHDISDDCWCHPANELVTDTDGRNRWHIIHRRPATPIPQSENLSTPNVNAAQPKKSRPRNRPNLVLKEMDSGPTC